MAQLRVTGKTKEHKTALELLKIFPLKGTLFTGDAAFTQRDFCEAVIAGGGDYFLTVKENQPTLEADIRKVLAPFHRSRTTAQGLFRKWAGTTKDMVSVWRARTPPVPQTVELRSAPTFTEELRLSRRICGCVIEKGIRLEREDRVLGHPSLKMELRRFIGTGSAPGCVSRQSSIVWRSSSRSFTAKRAWRRRTTVRLRWCKSSLGRTADRIAPDAVALVRLTIAWRKGVSSSCRCGGSPSSWPSGCDG